MSCDSRGTRGVCCPGSKSAAGGLEGKTPAKKYLDIPMNDRREIKRQLIASVTVLV